MALTKETKIAKIEMIGDYKIIHVAYDNVFKEDGEVVSTSRTRDIVEIGNLDNSNNLVLNDFSKYEKDVQDVIAVAYTDTIKENWKQFLISQKNLKNSFKPILNQWGNRNGIN